MSYIFLHGLGQNQSNWKETIDEMSKDLYIDCPNLFDLCENELSQKGCFQSRMDAAMSMDMLIQDRGIERHFDNEEEAVQYVYEQISDGKVSNSHLAAFTFDSAEIEYVEKELEEMYNRRAPNSFII